MVFIAHGSATMYLIITFDDGIRQNGAGNACAVGSWIMVAATEKLHALLEHGALNEKLPNDI